jgi:N-acetylmuramoyl-L-alanine amidase
MSSFPPDSPVVARIAASPNHDERKGVADIILLHYTGMEDTQAALQRLCDPESKVSCHYLVDERGIVVQLVPEMRRAWHAGLSSWEGVTDINSRSIGIEIANPGHDFGYPDFPEPQIAAVITLCRDVIGRRAIRPDRVLAHSDVAPSRKSDPGEKFPWRRLYQAGVGLWVEHAPSNSAEDAEIEPAAIADLQRAFARYGYGIAVTGLHDAATREVVTAFQRHFRPARVDGRPDLSTLKTLQALIAARDALRTRSSAEGSV